MSNSWKVKGIGEAARNPEFMEARSADADQQRRAELKAQERLITAIDHALNTSSEPSPQDLVPVVLEHLAPADRDAAFRETLRAYIELRIYERQREPQLVRTESDKVRENRLRRMAQRQGLALHKSRRRDLRALDYGAYYLVGVTAPGGRWRSGEVVTPEYGINLDGIERFLTADGD